MNILIPRCMQSSAFLFPINCSYELSSFSCHTVRVSTRCSRLFSRLTIWSPSLLLFSILTSSPTCVVELPLTPGWCSLHVPATCNDAPHVCKSNHKPSSPCLIPHRDQSWTGRRISRGDRWGKLEYKSINAIFLLVFSE